MRDDTEDLPDYKGLTADYFDRRSETYDQDAIHPRLAAMVIRHARLEPGLAVLDIGTGTGRIALHASKLIGDTGSVVAIDLSAEMLTQAHFKAGMESLTNIQFVQGDAENMDLEDATFDRVLCSSAFVLLSSPLSALQTWHRWLKPGGIVAFDAPGEPFGINSVIADVALSHGIALPYATAANTPEKCATLLAAAGFETLEIKEELLQEHAMHLGDALAIWPKSIAHPACHKLAQLPAQELAAIREEFETRVTQVAADGIVMSRIAMNIVTGRRQ
ncbi:class I SAM-dependent methyltransferase [Phyllobacterium lublinensis]|uniref:class I SAM-dependent methyltransferase n=1 Tax=Phyllobacterium lublinensis TaxID=2875708 RepID=UPI001CCF24DF|nr:methyltransferase domain-containing protein [Phyllobacterium sp. 2063]MBZ9657082.1 methyltransferase domain-containing protein [Phyllobacterium sp. 2063]